ncbi:MAG TPA: FGGY family carbohydrate kinase [Anaerolineales bacterium]|nr:FGGY family carbohydrate kinase [Anaerolineales bacterium]
MDYVIGCDVGSQGTMGILLSLDGKLICEAYAGYPMDYPQPLWAEQPVDHWVNALHLVVRQLLAVSGVSAGTVRALSLATQVDGVIPIDENGQPLRSAIIWMDRRAATQCESVRQAPGSEQVFLLTGLNLDASHVAPKIRWLAEQQPDIYQRARYFLLPGSYLAYYLTGELAVDYSNASSTLLLDVRTKTWSGSMGEAFQIDLHKMPPLGAATMALGKLRPQIAEQLGLSTNTMVTIGCGDEHAACLGAGITGPGLVADIVGTAEPVCAASRVLIFDSSHLLETHCHADPELWLLENPGFVSGGNYRWWRDQFAEGQTYSTMDEEASPIPPGAEGLTFLPSLMGALAPTWNESARGTFSGFTLAHTRAHFVRALLEGSAFAVRDITTQMQASGLDLRELRVVGGGAKSRLWNQIKADVTGLQVGVPEVTETTALGAAFLALVGMGSYTSLSEAGEHIVQIRERIDPNPSVQPVYAEAYERYRQTYFALLPVFEETARRGV